MIALLMQYFKNGLEVVAKKRKCPQNKIKVVMFQHMINIAMATPINAEL